MSGQPRDIFYLGGTHIQETNNYGVGRDGPWDRLHGRAAPNAMHDSDTLEQQGICLEDTRTIVLKLLSDYLSSTATDSPNVLWLNGPAGSGKSAIARTIAKSASEARTLLGNFFFYHADTTRNTKDPFLPTLAVQICRKFREARRLVEQAIEEDPFIFSKSTRGQATALIIDPLKHVLATQPGSPADSRPLTVLIDGLDECTDPDRQVEIIDILVELVTALNTSSHPRIKVVIFSRPEAHIRKRAAHHEQAGHVLSVALKDDLNPQSDIELYYNARFEDIRRHHPIGRSLGPSWPSPEEMKILFDMTGTHFALAHTVHGFVADPNKDPKSQLKIVLSLDRRRSNTPQAFLDQLYHEILSRIPKSILPQALRVVRAILVPHAYVLYPSPPLLQLVFSLQEGELQDIFSHLESLFDLGDRVSSRIRVYHKTLADFLFDASRSEQYGLFVKKSAISKDIEDSVRLVFVRERVPSAPAIAAFYIYIRQLDFRRRYISMDLRVLYFDLCRVLRYILRSPRPGRSPWEIAFLLEANWRYRPILSKLATPDFKRYAVQMVKDDRSRDYPKAFSVYQRFPLGRFCLVLLPQAFTQTYDEQVHTFYQAFIRHALRSDNDFLYLDQSVGWNLVTCNLDNLARAWIYLRAQSNVYRNICEQVLDDILKPEWVISRLGMLHLWHNGDHRITDDPWEHAGRRADVEIASEPQLSCAKCVEVLDLCKAQVLCRSLLWVMCDWRDLTRIRETFDHIRSNLTLWNHRELVARFAYVVKPQPPESLGTDDEPKKIAICLKEQADKLDQTVKDTARRLNSNGWNYIFTAVHAGLHPYSRACIPIDPSEEHAFRVAERRAAWIHGYDLKEVSYTYPPGSQ